MKWIGDITQGELIVSFALIGAIGILVTILFELFT